MKKQQVGTIYARSKQDNTWYRLAEGTGDNLSQEDIDEGYIDYIYYDTFENLEELYDNENDDGGMILLKKLYQEQTVENLISIANDFFNDELVVVEECF